jgi:Tfp pilus assembly protein PilN
MLVVRDMVDVSKLQRLVDDQQGAVAAASQLRRRVQSEESQRQDLIARQMQNDPLHILDALTRAIPASAWVQRLEWNGQTVRIVGFRTGEADLPAALRASSVFSNPRAASGEAPAKSGAQPPFDITADAPRRPRP